MYEFNEMVMFIKMNMLHLITITLQYGRGALKVDLTFNRKSFQTEILRQKQSILHVHYNQSYICIIIWEYFCFSHHGRRFVIDLIWFDSSLKYINFCISIFSLSMHL